MRLNSGPDAEQGRGLALVEALTSRWGWQPAGITGMTKFVWAEWRLPIQADVWTSADLLDRSVRLDHRCHLSEEETMQESPGPDPGRGHDVSGLTNAELERVRRELQASLALARPDSPASVPTLAHLRAIDTELAGRSASCGLNGTPPGPGSRTPDGAAETSVPLSEIG